MRNASGWRALAAAVLTGSLVATAAVVATADDHLVVVESLDFTDGTYGDWAPSGVGPDDLAVVDVDGNAALQVSNVSNDYTGIKSPAGLLEPGRTYTFSMDVRLPEGAAGTANARFVMDPGYGWIGNTSINATGWTTVTGQFTVPADAAAESHMVYTATDSYSDGEAPHTYLVDNVLITTDAESGGDPGVQVVDELDFADGTYGEWTPSGVGPDDLTVVDVEGDPALQVSNVSNDYTGIKSPAGLLEPGQTYTFAMDVRLPAGASGTADARFVMDPGYAWIGNTQINATGWTTVTGQFTVPSDAAADSHMVYTATASYSDGEPPHSYLIDNVTITTEADTGVGPEPGTVAISTDFEDGLDGWGPRDNGTGAPSVTLSSDAHAGTQAALVSERTSQGSGIGLPVAGVLEGGAAYELTAWLKFAAGETPDNIWLTLEHASEGADPTYATLAQFDGMSNSEWVQVSATFTAPPFDTGLLYFETSYQGGDTGNTSSFLVDDITVVVPEPAVIQDITPIKDTQPFPVGVAIDSRETVGAPAELLLRHFDQVTLENHMKPEAWYNADGVFTPHPEMDAVMDFAVANDLNVYGHVLVWHSQTPAWFFEREDGTALTNSAADQALLTDRMRTHIYSIAEYLHDEYGEFGGGNPVNAFDVVNEVVSDGGEYADGLRRSPWYAVLGEEYIDLAFQFADEAFNDVYAAEGAVQPVTLYINDYNTEQGGKQNRYYDLVERLLGRGVPLHGVGHQFHVSLAMPVSALEAAIVRFEGLDVTQAVTELDVTTGTPVTEARLIDQGYYYRDAFRVFRDHADSLQVVTVWGLTDNRSWRSDAGDPLVFNSGLQAKPAYYGIVDVDLPDRLRTANVFQGSVALDAAAPEAIEWEQLPLHSIEDAAKFQTRWAPDHLTVYVQVDDATVDVADSVVLEIDGTTYAVNRNGTGDVASVVTEHEGGYTVVTHLPLDPAATQGDTVQFDARVTNDGTVSGWNSPGALGTLTLIEPLSYLEVVAAPATPAVDGAVDDSWDAANVVSTDKQVEGSGGATAQVRTLWEDNTLYVLAEVTDPDVDVTGSDPWIQDSVEIYVDAGNFKEGSYRYDDMQVRISAANAVSFGTGDEGFQAARVESATQLTDTGYTVEASISLLEYGGAGTFHGLDFQVNDASAGARTAIHNWADPTGAGYQSTARWGVGQLMAADVVLPTTPPVDAKDLKRHNRGEVDVPRHARQGQTIPVYVGAGVAGETVDAWLYLDTPVLTRAVVDAEGHIDVTIPADSDLGNQRLAVFGDGGELIGWDNVTVKPAQAGGGPGTPTPGTPGWVSSIVRSILDAVVPLLRELLSTLFRF